MAGIKRDLRRAMEAVLRDISGNAAVGGKYAGAISAEGYAGGYRDALSDVEQALNGWPSSNSRYWPSLGPIIAREKENDHD